MKKSIVAILMALVLMLSVVGCAQNEPAPAPVEPSEPVVSDEPAVSDDPAEPEGLVAPEGYPDGPISVLVGYTAGGGSDLAMRTLIEFMAPVVGEAMTVSNLPGGGATVCVSQLATSPNDGQTIGLVTLSSQSVSPYSLDLPYTIDDFEYIGAFGAYTYALLVPADSPYQTFDDILAATEPVQVSYTSNLHEMLARKIVSATNANLDTVYYSSTSDAITDLLGGFIPVALGDIASYSSYVVSGQLRVIASCSDDRWPVAPEVETLVEQGYEGAAMSSYLGVAVPKGTDPAIVEYLRAVLAQVSSDETFQARLFEVTKLQTLSMSADELYNTLVAVYDEAATIYGPIA